MIIDKDGTTKSFCLRFLQSYLKQQDSDYITLPLFVTPLVCWGPGI